MNDAPFPPILAEALRPVLPALSDDLVAAIADGVPAYRRPLEGAFGEGVRRGVDEALARFVDFLAGERLDADRRRVYVALGQDEQHAGRSLDGLLAAYRVGARVMWRRFAEVGQRAGLGPEVMHPLAEALFAYVDELSAESAEGFARAQSAAAGERARQRQHVIDLLARATPPDSRELARAAEAATWEIPQKLAPLVAYGDPPAANQLQPRLPVGAVAGTRQGALVVLVPDPDAPGRDAELERALGNTPAVRGPAVPPADLAPSLERAALGARLQAGGVLPSHLVHAEHHLLELLIHADEGRARDLSDGALAPLDKLAPAARRRLTATLGAWLDHQGRATDAAAALTIHVQTMRYRSRQLHALLEPKLGTARGRLELQLALRIRAARVAEPSQDTH